MSQVESLSVLSDVSLKNYTTLKVGGAARYLVEVNTLLELQEALDWAFEKKLPWVVIGKGSNLLVNDSGFWGLAIINRIMQLEWTFTGDEAIVQAGAGENLAALAAKSAKEGWAGLEFACGIPGSVGGGVAMNAGAHARCLADCLIDATFYSREKGLQTRPLADLDISYRHSRFLDSPEVVVAARFRLKKDLGVKERLKEMTQYRLSTQPWKSATAGCFFRNPSNCIIEGKPCSAGYLIEKSGLKGYTYKGAKVSEIHANFLVNNEGASAQDFLDLCEQVRKKVHENFGVWLQGEVRFLNNPSGSFDYV